MSATPCYPSVLEGGKGADQQLPPSPGLKGIRPVREVAVKLGSKLYNAQNMERKIKIVNPHQLQKRAQLRRLSRMSFS